MQTTTLLWAGAAVALAIVATLAVAVRRRARHDAERRRQAEMAALIEAQQLAKALAAERAARQEAAAAAAKEARAREAADYAEAVRLRAHALEAAERDAAERRAREARESGLRESGNRAAMLRAAQIRQAADRERADFEETERQRLVDEQTPTIAAPPEPAPPAVFAPHRPEDTLVMVADDSKVVRVKTSRLLAQHGYRVVLAEDGAEAARLIEHEVPRVLVTDVEMPGLDGFALTRLVRQHPQAAGIPIIMITSADDRLKAAAAEAGVTLVLGKPYPEEALLACIQQTTARAATAAV
jgi:CheY-like chemotaxis protein